MCDVLHVYMCEVTQVNGVTVTSTMFVCLDTACMLNSMWTVEWAKTSNFHCVPVLQGLPISPHRCQIENLWWQRCLWKWLDWYRAYDVSTLLHKCLFYPLGIWCECKGCVCPKQGCRTAGAFPRPIDSIRWLWRRSVEVMWKKTSSSKSNHSSQSRVFCHCSSFFHSSPSVGRLSGLQLVCTHHGATPNKLNTHPQHNPILLLLLDWARFFFTSSHHWRLVCEQVIVPGQA